MLKIRGVCMKENLRDFLNKDVKDFSVATLVIPTIVFLTLVAVITYKVSNSYALFTDDIQGSQTIKLHYRGEENKSGQKQNSANEPVLLDNMIPVYYDQSAGVWKKADASNINESFKWYDYNTKMWANSVTVSSEKRKMYLEADPGETIAMSDVLTMQVWIPRYKYKVWNYNEDGKSVSNPQAIEITFEKGTSTTGDIMCSDSISGTDGKASQICKYNKTLCSDKGCNGKTYTHPAFTIGEQELTGIWVGKFELTGSISDITVKPDLKSIVNQQGGAFDDAVRGMKNDGNKYGFSVNSDIHVIKNMEWAAVAYLAHSNYGLCENDKCSEIYINNSSDYYTGRAGSSAGDDTTSDEGTYKYNNIGKGTNASTTYNVYGVYDMSGGAREYVMGNVVASDGDTLLSGTSTDDNSGFIGNIGATVYPGIYKYPEDKYFDTYSYGSSNNQRLRSKIADAIKEVYNSNNVGWYKDSNNLAYSTSPWIYRGGRYSDGMNAGLFSSSEGSGSARSYDSTRLVISVIQ